MRKIFSNNLTGALILAALPLLATAQTRSAKRGVCWDENTQSMTDAPIEKMMPGVAWIYNWGVCPARELTKVGVEGGMDYAPMCWTQKYDEKRLRAYIQAHPSVKYLLGFNEPNFMYQANLTPKVAAARWPKLEQIAADYGLRLVAPVLNFTGDHVGGRAWTPLEWIDEFIKQYKQKHKRLPRIDCLALHCYMNWYSSHMWYATDYFYRDLFDPANETYGKYPSLVELMETYKQAHGHFPRMMLTEFCSWEGDKDGFKLNVDNQIDQMTQKVQKMEQSDLVEGYAWFMANGTAAVTPFFSLFQTNWPDSELSDLGTVYVHMSSFDKTKYYEPGTPIQAKDYVDASTDDIRVSLRPNGEEGSPLPLQVEFRPGSFAVYQIAVPRDGTYRITLHGRADAETALGLSADNGQAMKAATVATGGQWQDTEATLALTQGQHTLRLWNLGGASFMANAWSF